MLKNSIRSLKYELSTIKAKSANDADLKFSMNLGHSIRNQPDNVIYELTYKNHELEQKLLSFSSQLNYINEAKTQEINIYLSEVLMKRKENEMLNGENIDLKQKINYLNNTYSLFINIMMFYHHNFMNNQH